VPDSTLSVLVLRLTHTGKYADGRPCNTSVLITDTDFGFELQTRKTPAYVPVGGSIELPLTSRTLYSLTQGNIAGFVRTGVLEASSILRLRDFANKGGPTGDGVDLAPLLPNIRRVANQLQFLLSAGDVSGYIVGESISISGLSGAFTGLNGTYQIDQIDKGLDFAGPNPAVYRFGVVSEGPDLLQDTLGGVTIELVNGRVGIELSGSGNAGGLGADAMAYVGGQANITLGLDPTYLQLSAVDSSVVPANSLFSDSSGSWWIKGGTGFASQVAQVGESGGFLVWSTAGDGDVETWEEVYALIRKAAKYNHPLGVVLHRTDVDPMFIVPAGEWDVNFAALTSLMYGNPNQNMLVLSDGAVLINPGFVRKSVSVVGNSSQEIFKFQGLGPGSPGVLLADLGSFGQNQGSAPAIRVRSGEFGVLALNGAAIVEGSGAPIVEVQAGGILQLEFLDPFSVHPSVVTSEPGSLVVLKHRGMSWPWFPPGVLGDILNQPYGQSGGAGPTSFRPDASGAFGFQLSLGCTYWDTDISKAIWWNGSLWVDSAGNPA
jgi:hypothetical protein